MTKNPDQFNRSVANTDLIDIPVKRPGDDLLECRIIVIGIMVQVKRVTCPGNGGGKGVCTRAEIQHVFPGFFLLPLPGPPMHYLFFVGIFHEQNPLITQFVASEPINAFCEGI
jgi:hypothetical protein